MYFQRKLEYVNFFKIKICLECLPLLLLLARIKEKNQIPSKIEWMSDYTQSAKEILIVTSFSKWGLSREGLTIFTYLLEFWNIAIRNSDWCTGATVLFKSLKEIFLITRNYNAKIATNLQCSNARIMKECLFRKKMAH